MPAHKLSWIFRDGIDNPKYQLPANTAHLDGCVSCHGGTDGTADYATAHAGVVAMPASASCDGCHVSHDPIVDSAAGSLHTTVKGYETILGARGFDFTDTTTSLPRYQKQCAKCHVADDAGVAACGQCHLSVPASAGGGLLDGHRIARAPDTVLNCTACHGSRVKDEYFGQNQALYLRNQFAPELAANDPFKAAGTVLQPDVHKTGGLRCVDCHSGAEMHGAGVTTGIDRYGVTSAPACLDCHSPTVTDDTLPEYMGNATMHSAGHLAAMSCQVCHAQPYKSCFGCHTQEDAETLAGYFIINSDDPTRNLRSPAWSATAAYAVGAYVRYNSVTYKAILAVAAVTAPAANPTPDTDSTHWLAALPAGDALMTFRVGKNPRYVVGNGEPEYGVLRHVPVDADVFTYTVEGTQATGLIPNLTAAPTWKFATPHNIAKTTLIASACTNCHGADYVKFWLTDPIVNAYGWVPAGTTWETTANAGVVVGTQPAFTLP